MQQPSYRVKQSPRFAAELNRVKLFFPQWDAVWGAVQRLLAWSPYSGTQTRYPGLYSLRINSAPPHSMFYTVNEGAKIVTLESWHLPNAIGGG